MLRPFLPVAYQGTIDAATDADLTVAGGTTSAGFVYGGAVTSSLPHSEGNAFNAGKITVSPIDGNISVRDPDAYDALAGVLGTTYGAASKAPSTLTFKVSQDAYQGNAQFLVTVNGKQIGGIQTATAAHGSGLSSNVTLLDFFDTDISRVGVEFVNDLYGGSKATDRNLYVDKLTLNGRAYEGERALNENGFNLSTEAVLNHNGKLTFITERTLVLRVSEDAYRGDAQFIAKVNGVQVGGVQTVTASHAAGAYQDIVLTGVFGHLDSLSINFTNDLWGGTSTTDRNLYVDKLTVGSRVYEGEAARVGAGAGVLRPTEALLYSNGELRFQL